MNEVGALIRRLRKDAGLKQRELAEHVGTQPSRISNYERGERYPSTTDAFALGRFFGRDGVDFLDPKRVRAPASPVEDLDPSGPARIVQSAAVHIRAWPVPVLDEQSWFCPNGCAYFGEPFLTRFNINPIRCVVAEIHDGSMEPRLPEGCVVLIDRRKTEPQEREVYAVRHNDQLLIRRASLETDHWVFRADAGNHYGAVHWDKESMPIIGCVIWSSRLVGSTLEYELSVSEANGEAAPVHTE